jgi:hypothetical protein
MTELSSLGHKTYDIRFATLCKTQPRSSSKGRYNYKNGKMGWGHLKIFFFRTTEPEKLIFT